MVLNYKYYEMDLKTIYVNKSFMKKSHSDKGERIMRNIFYDGYTESSRQDEVRNSDGGSEMLASEIQVVFIGKPSKWERFLSFCKNVCSCRSCICNT